MTREVPVIDVGPLVRGVGDRAAVARAIDAASREHGFFSIVGHGIDPELPERLESAARAFFALDAAEKAAIGMEHGGRAWRGWFPVGGELTSGVPDRKEGIYFGAELPVADARVRTGLPLHGPNLFPERPPELRAAVLEWIAACTALGQQVMAGIALGLGLDERFFAADLTADPVVLFRIFHYPARRPGTDDGRAAGAGWGVAEHTDYGLLTMLLQDDTGGLEVRTRDGWVDVEPLPGALVCNLGDMLERMTAGRYRSTPHRVRVPDAVDRIACPFFFDPGWDAEVRPLPLGDAAPAEHPRWDGVDLHTLDGTYGEYLLAKVSKVFPALRDEVLG